MGEKRAIRFVSPPLLHFLRNKDGWGPIVFSKAFFNRLRPQHDKQHVLAEVIVGVDDVVCLFGFVG
jgi:hypothetical protein